MWTYLVGYKNSNVEFCIHKKENKKKFKQSLRQENCIQEMNFTVWDASTATLSQETSSFMIVT